MKKPNICACCFSCLIVNVFDEKKLETQGSFIRAAPYCFPARYTKNRAIKEAPMSMINADQNWNQPLSVPASRKTFATTAAPSQNTKLPTVSAIRLIGDRTPSLRAKMTICSIPTANRKFMTAVKKPMCAEGFAGAGRLMVP